MGETLKRLWLAFAEDRPNFSVTRVVEPVSQPLAPDEEKDGHHVKSS